jgi:putative oxidoreductase
LTHSAGIAQLADVNSTLGKYSGYAYAVMRIIVGLLFACHGAQKVFGMFGGKVASGMMMVVGVIELVGGFMIALGLLTMPVAFLCCGLMAVAYFKAHAGSGFMPIVNRGELAVVYCFVFLYMFFRGAGPLSLDNLIFGGRSTTAPDSVGGPMRTGRSL